MKGREDEMKRLEASYRECIEDLKEWGNLTTCRIMLRTFGLDSASGPVA